MFNIVKTKTFFQYFIKKFYMNRTKNKRNLEGGWSGQRTIYCY